MRLARLLIPAAIVSAAVLLLVLPAPAPGDPHARRFTIDAAQFAFAPGRFEVNRGDRVTLTLTASDVVHGFFLDGYGIERRMEPGRSVNVEFVADQAGKFRYRCSVSCGALHPFMIGELVVGPNTPFWQAAGLVLLALAGILFHLWHSKGISDGKVQQQTQGGGGP